MPEDSEKTEPSIPELSEQSAPANLPLFYQKPEPLNPSAHGGKGLRRPADYRFTATSHAVVLHAEEFRVACAHYPIVFAGDESATTIM